MPNDAVFCSSICRDFMQLRAVGFHLTEALSKNTATPCRDLPPIPRQVEWNEVDGVAVVISDSVVGNDRNIKG
jgi:hypothetical protein